MFHNFQIAQFWIIWTPTGSYNDYLPKSKKWMMNTYTKGNNSKRPLSTYDSLGLAARHMSKQCFKPTLRIISRFPDLFNVFRQSIKDFISFDMVEAALC